MAIASLVLGIISIVFVFSGPLVWLGPIIGIIGIVLGALARKKLPEDQRGLATAGLVCSIVGTVLSVIFYLACIACIGGLSTLNNVQ